MVTTAVLVMLLLVASYTDWRWGKVYNKLVYSGIVLAFALNLGVEFWEVDEPSAPQTDPLGLVGIEASLLGFAACGAVMLVCYVFFAGQVGGGDVKLIAMIGAWLGVYQGLEAMLWTFVVAGCAGLIYAVWSIGAANLARRAATYVRVVAKTRTPVSLTPEERRPLKRPLFLAPSAAAAVLIVRFQLLDWLQG